MVVVANVTATGSIQQTIKVRAPKGTEELNLKAFRVGHERAREASVPE